MDDIILKIVKSKLKEWKCNNEIITLNNKKIIKLGFRELYLFITIGIKIPKGINRNRNRINNWYNTNTLSNSDLLLLNKLYKKLKFQNITWKNLYEFTIIKFSDLHWFN